MNTTKLDVCALIHEELERWGDQSLRRSLESVLTDPYPEFREYFDVSQGKEQRGVVWIIARLDARVRIAYSRDGYGKEGLAWGLVFLDRNDYGASGSWYASLIDLVADSGNFSRSDAPAKSDPGH